MKRFKSITGLALAFIIFFSGMTGSFAVNYGDYLDTMMKFYSEQYYKAVPEKVFLKGALKGMLNELDPYSDFYDMEEYLSLSSSMGGNFSGIGAVLEPHEDGIRILDVYENSPAEKAGVQDGDIILKIEDKATKGMTAELAASLIRGEEGTGVTLTIYRQGAYKVISIKRGSVIVNPVQYRIEENFAYIRIDSFNNYTAQYFEEAMDKVDEKGLKRIMLDLRGNPGGYVPQAVAVASRLMQPGIVSTLRFRSQNNADYQYVNYEKNPTYILAILTDENTASASEILTGALEDAGIGVVIGGETYGKGVVQSFFPVLTPEAYERYFGSYVGDVKNKPSTLLNYALLAPDEDLLGVAKITSAFYITPKGRTIDGEGLKPRYETEPKTLVNGLDLSGVNFLYGPDSDLQSYSPEVYAAEQILKAAGYLDEAPNKLFDQATFNAVKSYQGAKGLPVTGKLDEATRKSLNETLNSLRNANDPPYKEALSLFGLLK